MAEKINHPKHYNAGPLDDDGTARFEPIKVIEAWQLSFSLGNTVKYIARAGRKATGKNATIEDLKKAEWYLRREIERLSKQAEPKTKKRKR